MTAPTPPTPPSPTLPGGPPSEAQARTLLATFLERAAAGPDPTIDPYWYRLRYIDLTDRYNRALAAGSSPRAAVLPDARALVLDLERTVLAGTARRRFGRPREAAVVPFLLGIESTVLVFLADAVTLVSVRPGDAAPARVDRSAQHPVNVRRELVESLASGASLDAAGLLRSAREVASWPPRALYNLACYWSMSATAATDDLRDECLDAALESMTVAVAGDPSLAQLARTDPTLAAVRVDGRTATGFGAVLAG